MEEDLLQSALWSCFCWLRSLHPWVLSQSQVVARIQMLGVSDSTGPGAAGTEREMNRGGSWSSVHGGNPSLLRASLERTCHCALCA